MNYITVCGNLTKEPELRSTTNGTPVAIFTIASNYYKGKNEPNAVDFIDCIAWNNDATYVNSYARKGMTVTVFGEMHSRDWTDKNGNKRVAWEVTARKVVLPSKGSATYTEPAGEFAVIEDDGDLPF